MASARIELPPGPTAPDLILVALLQSRLRERSLYLGQVIQLQRRRQSAPRRSALNDDQGADEFSVQLAEQALVAVQRAQQRLDSGSYGLCDDCKQPIGLDDLLAVPEQTLCRGCSPFSGLEGIALEP